jgi:hypothetical protein
MEQFINMLKAHASALDRAQGQPRFGIVSSIDTARYAARVMLQPEGVLSGWLPILSPWVGAGWGVACLPAPGDQVMVLAQEGDAEHGVVIGASFSDSARAPQSALGEFWIVHKSGSFLKLLNDGTVQMQGDLHVAGDVYDRHGSLSQLRGHYDAHTHGVPQGGSTTTPTPQD